MLREHLSDAFYVYVLTCHPGITSRSSVTEKTHPRQPKISQWSSRSMTSHSTQFTERSPLAVRNLRDCLFLRIYLPKGSDGTVNFWDKDARTRLKGEVDTPNNVFQCLTLLHQAAFDPSPGPIAATAFNRNGNIFAYAVSYDWSKGHSGMTPGHPNKIMLHACKEEEVKKRPPKR